MKKYFIGAILCLLAGLLIYKKGELNNAKSFRAHYREFR